MNCPKCFPSTNVVIFGAEQYLWWMFADFGLSCFLDWIVRWSWSNKPSREMKQRWRRKAVHVCQHTDAHLRICVSISAIAQMHSNHLYFAVLQHCSVFKSTQNTQSTDAHHTKCQPFLFNYNWCSLICHSVQVLSRCHIEYVNCSDDCLEWAYGWCMTGMWSAWLIATDGGTMNCGAAWGHQTALFLHRHSPRRGTAHKEGEKSQFLNPGRILIHWSSSDLCSNLPCRFSFFLFPGRSKLSDGSFVRLFFFALQL